MHTVTRRGLTGTIVILAAGYAGLAAATDTKLAGTAFGTAPYASGSEYYKATDGNTNTYFDASAASGGYTGIDLGTNTSRRVTKVRYVPRPTFASRMTSGVFQGSNAGTNSGFADLCSVASTPAYAWNEVTSTNTAAFRYLRYYGPANGYCNIAEIEFYTLGGMDNLAPTGVTATAANLNGLLTATGTTFVSVFWGTTDGGATPSWDAHADLGACPTGIVTCLATNLTGGADYYYAYYEATSQVWATPSVYFITGTARVDAVDASCGTTGADTGLFSISRPASCTGQSLTVSFTLGGTTTNGTDYSLSATGSVTLAAGATNTTLTVSPLKPWNTGAPRTIVLSLSPGAYALGGGSSATCTLETAANVCKVWTGAPSSTAPYTTWDTAATSIWDAVAWTMTNTAYDTIVVTNGAYGVTNTLNVTNGVTVRSMNGAAFTTIYLSNTGALNRVLYVSSANAVIDGFTITNGFATEKQGVGVYLQSGTLRNCVITKNLIPQKVSVNNQQGAGLYQNGGLVENCVISNNVMYHEQASAGGAYVNGGTMRACRIVNNRMSGTSSENGVALYVNNSAVVENCLIAGNTGLGGSSGLGGGAVYVNSGTLRNCTVVGNALTNQATAGIYRNGGSVINCIASGNRSVRNDLLCYQANTTNGFSFSCATELTAGSGNIAADPDFVDPASGDYRLAAGSPCHNGGTNYAGLAATDLAGSPRLAESTVDMGAFEGVLPGGVFLGVAQNVFN